MATFGSIARLPPTDQFYPIATALSPIAVSTKTTPVRFQFATGATWASSGASATLATVAVVSTFGSRRIPTWAFDYRGLFPNTTPSGNSALFNLSFPTIGIPITGSIQGQVQENGVAVANRRVFLYYRPTGQLISQTMSDTSGNYSFTSLEPGVNKYYIVGLNVLPLQYDAVVHDTISAQ